MNDPKLLIAGSQKIYAMENNYVRHLRTSGARLDIFPAYDLFIDYYEGSLFHKLLFKSGLSGIYKEINRAFKENVLQYKPDIVWVFKGMELFPATLEWVREQGIKLVNYNPDNPLVFSGTGSGNRYVTASIPLYDLHLTYDIGIKKELETRYGVKTGILPFGFENNEELYQVCERQEEVIKTCFVGNPDAKRASFIQALAENGIRLDVYGNEWNKSVSHANITLFPPVYGDEQWKVLRRYRAQLNLMRVHNENSHNMRSFEVPGIGGIMVAPVTEEHSLYFEDGKEVFLYHDVQDCTDLLNRLLLLDRGEAGTIRQAARARSLRSGYSYEARAKQAWQFLRSV